MAGLIHGLVRGRFLLRQATVVLAIDGVGDDIARTAWTQAELTTLVSTFPTTSATAWLTALTGAPVEQHLVPGMAFRVGGTDVLAVASGTAGLLGLPGSQGSVLRRLARDGVEPVVLPGMIGRYPGPWAQALWDGAQVHTGEPHHLTPEDPRRTVDDAVAAVEVQLRLGALAVLAYVDLDTAVHREGFSARVREALERIEQAALRWHDWGVATVGVSDHGAVPVEPDHDVRLRFDAVLASGRCAPVAGGAGRVRWLYTDGDPVDLAEELRSAIGDVAWVGTRADAVTAGFYPDRPAVLTRIGNVLAVAIDPRFPVPDERARHEHGAVTPAEALVPFAVW